MSHFGKLAALGAALAVTATLALTPVAPGSPLSPPPAAALDNGVAETPPMGWNSWNTFACNINEDLIKGMADAMVDSGMKDAGYEYVVVDDCWMDPNRDWSGKLQASPDRFPSGMKALGDYIHDRGLKFGLYQAPMHQTCAQRSGNYPGSTGSLGHVEQDADAFAEWGVDYLKYDWCSDVGDLEYQETALAEMRDALAATGRPIVYSTNVNSFHWGGHGPKHDWGGVSNMWRTTEDIKPVWDTGNENWNPMGIVNIIDTSANLAHQARPGAWNDLDMLEVGVYNVEGWWGLTPDEARAHFTMWSAMASPLMAGADLRYLGQEDLGIMTNPEIIALNQDPLGAQAVRLRDDGDQEVWVKSLEGGDLAVVLFNRGGSEARIETTADEVGASDSPAYVLRDLWAHSEVATTGKISAVVPSHGTVALRVTPTASTDAVPAATLTLGQADRFSPAAPAQVTATLTNDGPTALTGADVTLKAPEGWTVQPSSPVQPATAAPGESMTAEWTVTPPSDLAHGYVPVGATATYGGERGGTATLRSTTPLVSAPAGPRQDAYLSDLDWFDMYNSWGPLERDLSNGEEGQGDGQPLTIGGRAFEKGLGGHATTSVSYFLGGSCQSMSAMVGIDDEVGDSGSAVFEVWADGKRVSTSDVVRGTDAAQEISADLSGAQVLQLVTTDAGDGIDWDHADWADAQVSCAPAQTLDVPVTVTQRCVASQAYLNVVAANEHGSPVSVRLSTAFGKKEFASVGAGKNAFHAFSTRLGVLPAGQVTAVIDGEVDGEPATSEVVIPYPAANC